METVVLGAGPTDARLMFVGERPGRQEAKAGYPFAGPSGRELERYLWDYLRLDRTQVYLTNLVKTYKESDPDPTEEEINNWGGHFLEELEEVKPDILVTLGAFSSRFVLGKQWTMEAIHGFPARYRDATSEVDCMVFPMFHPAAGMHNTETQGVIWHDFVKLGIIADMVQNGNVLLEGFDRPTDEYENRTTYGEICRDSTLESLFAKYPGLPITIDTEGVPSRPFCLNFSFEPGTGFIIKSSNKSLISLFSKLLRRYRNPTIFHNALYDLGMLWVMGVDIADDQYTDTMVKSYLLRLEPQGLKNLAFRHCGMEMSDYLEIIAPYEKAKSEQYLVDARDGMELEVIEYAPSVGRKQNVFQRVKRIFMDYSKNSELNLRARWEKVETELRNPVEAVLGPMPTTTLEDVPHDVSVGYASRDADATLRIDPILDRKIDEMELRPVLEMDMAIMPMVDRMQHVGFLLDIKHLNDFGDQMLNEMAEISDKIEDLTGHAINPGSSPQTAHLLFDVLGLKSRKKTKGGADSTQDKVLEALKGAHPVVPLILDYRERSKLRDSFAVVLPQMVDPDGRIRPNLRVTRVSSGRLSSFEPNLMAQPIRSDLSLEIRKGFIAPEGFLLGAWDLDQIEMRVMAHESQDEELCQLFIDGRDVHNNTATNMFGVKEQDLDPMKHRYPAKRVGFGVITGITASGLYDQMFLAGVTEYTKEDCGRFIDEFFKIYPGVYSYMERKRSEARRNMYVRDMWGRIRYLPGVRSPLSWIREEALRQSHSHAIQAGAQGIIKKSMAKIWDQLKVWWGQDHQIEPLLQIHDELDFEFQEDIFDMTDPVITGLMNNTTKLMVPITSKGNCGRTWADCK